MSTLRRLAIVALFVTVALAAWLLERRPVVAVVLLLLVAAATFAVWWVRRAERKLTDAALRCDLDTLEAFSRAGSSRLLGTMALIHHGGFARARTSLCTCGECENDVMDDELERTARIVRAAYEGRGEQAHALAEELDLDCPGIPKVLFGHVSQLRLLTRFVAIAAAVEDAGPDGLPRPTWFDLVVEASDSAWPILRWPTRLAAARDAAARGERERTAKYLEGMPAWPEGTPLERVRRRLLEGVR